MPSPEEFLSEAQKKQNHIESEKRRREQLKAVYAELDSLIPVLEEDAVQDKASKKRKKGAAEATMARAEVDVLAGAVDYIKELLEERQQLRTQLQLEPINK